MTLFKDYTAWIYDKWHPESDDKDFVKEITETDLPECLTVTVGDRTYYHKDRVTDLLTANNRLVELNRKLARKGYDAEIAMERYNQKDNTLIEDSRKLESKLDAASKAAQYWKGLNVQLMASASKDVKETLLYSTLTELHQSNRELDSELDLLIEAHEQMMEKWDRLAGHLTTINEAVGEANSYAWKENQAWEYKDIKDVFKQALEKRDNRLREKRISKEDFKTLFEPADKPAE